MTVSRDVLENQHHFNANSFGRRFLFAAADASGARWSLSNQPIYL
jgi:hypothetical protein